MLTYEDRKNIIIAGVSKNFRSFGGGNESSWGNPISSILKDQPPQFAAGVDIGEVVEFVMRMAIVGMGLADPADPECQGIPMVEIYESSHGSRDIYGTGRYFPSRHLAMKDAEISHGKKSAEPIKHYCYPLGDDKYVLSKYKSPICVISEEAYRKAMRKKILEKLSDEEKDILGFVPVSETVES